MKGKAIGYWVCTGLMVFVMLPGGIFGALRVPQAVEGQTVLGFPVYFVVFLGVWKILGSIAIVVPKFPRLKEWAYAGMFFDLIGAVVANAARDSVRWHVFAPLAIVPILVASWALRPESRRLAGPSV
ncbi:MAG: DoxX family protein [Acidobacteriota bacterium]